MQLVEIRQDKEEEFRQIVSLVYKDNPCYRISQEMILRSIVHKKNSFHLHSSMRLFLISDQEQIRGRFALLQDKRLPSCVQLAFFEALPGLPDLASALRQKARQLFPDCKVLVAGLNGHLNYQAGFLLDHFSTPPLFRRPYTPPYYAEYFAGFSRKEIISFRFSTEPFQVYFKNAEDGVWNGITTRFMNKRHFRQELGRYTQLNNACFREYPYHAQRAEEEDYEVFRPLQPFLDNENLIFAELEGVPIGYLLWYPDLNEMLLPWQLPGWLPLLRFRLKRPVKTFHFSEVAVLPRYQISMASYALIFKMAVVAKKFGYTCGETSFIFKEDTRSLNLATKYLYRAFGVKMQPYRTFALFQLPL